MAATSEAGRTARRLGALLPLAILVLGINVMADPGRVLRRGPYERRVAELQASGQNVAGMMNHDDRLRQRFYAMSAPPAEVLVLGSSRAMQVRRAHFPGRRVYNASVSSASLEDVIALHELFRQRGWSPQTIVIQIDPWLLDGVPRTQRWDTLAPEHAAACVRLGMPLPPPRGQAAALLPLLELLTPTYFQASAAAVLRTLHGAPLSQELQPTTGDFAETRVQRADGSLGYERTLDSVTPAMVTANAAEWGRANITRFVRPDPRAIETLERLIRAMRADGADVVLLLPPYHPDTYAVFMEPGRGRVVAAAEDAVRAVAARTGARVMGSLDPALAGCDPAGFHDAIHPREACMARLLQPREPGDAGAPPGAAVSP